MSRLILSQRKLLGLLELDAAGTVLYSRLEDDGTPGDLASDLVGHDFYSEVAPFTNVEEFRQRLNTFSQSREPSLGFVFNCDYMDGAMPVKVLLTRMTERTND